MEVRERISHHSRLPEGEKIGSIYKDRNSQLVFYIKMQLAFLLTKNQSLMLLSNRRGPAWESQQYVTNLKSSHLKGDSISLIGPWGSWRQEKKKRFGLCAGYRWARSGKKDYRKEPEWGPFTQCPTPESCPRAGRCHRKDCTNRGPRESLQSTTPTLR